jgi:hypothetical protein
MRTWRNIIRDKENPPTDEELHDVIMDIPLTLYFAGEGIENLGIKSDISTAIRNEIYNKTHISASGTVAIKESLAELASQEEFIVQCAYKGAYKILKAKIDDAKELLNSAKKVISHRTVMVQLSVGDKPRVRNT